MSKWTYPSWMDGYRKHHQYENGYGASVVKSRYSYGGRDGLNELAVTRGTSLVYDTPITDDVIGYLTMDEVDTILARIEVLPAPQETS